MNKNIVLNDLNRICFFDIETVGQQIKVEDNEIVREFLAKKNKMAVEELTDENVIEKGGLYAETGKVICISCGIFTNETFYLKSFYGDDEKDILTRFVNMLEGDNFAFKYTLCGHNIEDFDIKFLAKRCIIHGIKLPLVMNIMTKKEWDYNFIDTMKLWAFGDSYNGRVSLKVLCDIFDIPSPKEDIDGSQVAKLYYQLTDHEEHMKRIVTYCQNDVVATTRVFQKITQNGYLEDERIIIR